MTQIIIPNSVAIIGNYAFGGCSSLAQIQIPDSVIIIEDFAFSICSSLRIIEIPDFVTSIGFNTFERYKSLVHCPLPSKVEFEGKNEIDIFHKDVILIHKFASENLENPERSASFSVEDSTSSTAGEEDDELYENSLISELGIFNHKF